jgi:hypothetical protein
MAPGISRDYFDDSCEPFIDRFYAPKTSTCKIGLTKFGLIHFFNAFNTLRKVLGAIAGIYGRFVLATAQRRNQKDQGKNLGQ